MARVEKLILNLFGIILCSQLVAAQQSAQARSQRHEHLATEIVEQIEVDYLLHLPEGYAEDPDQKGPLILFLHGAGERGSDLNLVATHGPPKIVETRPGFPFIVVSPQCPSRSWWKSSSLIALLDHIETQYRVDSDRIYLTGLSMGGYGTWELAGLYPDRFAAIAPICGGGSGIHARSIARAKLPAWVFHGAKDPVVPLEESERLVEVLRRASSPVDFTVYPEALHDSWTESYANESLYEWFLSKRLSNRD